MSVRAGASPESSGSVSATQGFCFERLVLLVLRNARLAQQLARQGEINKTASVTLYSFETANHLSAPSSPTIIEG
jgi:hypothetical protein